METLGLKAELAVLELQVGLEVLGVRDLKAVLELQVELEALVELEVLEA